jgi:hypothetical protein
VVLAQETPRLLTLWQTEEGSGLHQGVEAKVSDRSCIQEICPKGLCVYYHTEVLQFGFSTSFEVGLS